MCLDVFSCISLDTDQDPFQPLRHGSDISGSNSVEVRDASIRQYSTQSSSDSSMYPEFDHSNCPSSRLDNGKVRLHQLFCYVRQSCIYSKRLTYFGVERDFRIM